MDWIVPVAGKGEHWRERRRLLDRSLRPGATASHGRVIEEKTRTFLSRLLATPKNFRAHIDLSVLSHLSIQRPLTHM
jgi:cytochrome P450